ncbi:unnamed protein product [Onchocerca flexuosa]|uniref:Ovule protein n=1 Tax=Onchocerca flexuosa TaxID=387005 RepID=A0A183HG60_9BILA|nr:unnamed protein product [Onchocerca flexuosa]
MDEYMCVSNTINLLLIYSFWLFPKLRESQWYRLEVTKSHMNHHCYQLSLIIMALHFVKEGGGEGEGESARFALIDYISTCNLDLDLKLFYGIYMPTD